MVGEKRVGVEVTDAQLMVLTFVRAKCAEGCSPTLREIMAHFGWRSTNAPRGHLYALVDQGKLVHVPHTHRPWRVPKEST